MIRHLASRVAVVLMLTGSIGLAGCAPKPSSTPVTDANLQAKVQQARTSSDHQEIARYYDHLAATAEQRASEDLGYRKSYERPWHPGPPAAGQDPAARVGPSLAGDGAAAEHHYDRLIEQRQETAREYHGLAEWHRQMATQIESEAPANAGSGD